MFCIRNKKQNGGVFKQNEREDKINESLIMAVSNQILLVVSILEGRRFLRRPKHQVIVEAKFDGETLCTDPVNHTENPNFTTELAWELDKKTLHQHKLQRTPIKLQCYAIDTVLSQKEMVGYIILDLRSAQAKLQRPQWFPLLNSKYQRQKPEIKIRLTLEDDSVKKPENSLPEHSTPSKKEDIDPLGLEPVLNDENGFYQLGPTTKSMQIYVLSVTISYAVNLAKLIPSSFVVPVGQGFYFQYTLFGNNVTSEIFSDLLQPNFSPERASVRINSQLKHLRVFLENFPGIKITLYCGGHPLGTTNISLQSLLPADETFTSPSVLEALFPLSSTTEEHPPGSSNEAPAVGVSVMLKNDKTIVPSTQETNMIHGNMQARDSHQKAQGNEEDNATKQPTPNILHGETQRGTDELQVENRAENSKIFSPNAERSEQQPSDDRLSFHHFCYSVDLRSICDLQVTSSVNCYLKYSYPFFGSAAPVVTSPPVEVRRHMEVLLPKSFCAFDFATNPNVLKETLSSVPLVIEVWHRDPLTNDVLLGVARVTPGHVFSAKKLKAARGKPSTYGQILSERVHIIADDRKPIGELNVVLGLEDLGPVSREHLRAHMNGSESFSSLESPHHKSPDKLRKESRSEDPGSNDPRMMAEYQTALELEMWKQQQEELFTAQLKTKEVEKIKTLTEEWRKRDKEREILTKKKLEEYSLLEEKLKKTISDIEKRERQLLASETELMRMKEEQRREHERKMVELREASRRMKEDCEHQIEIERAKVRDAEDQKQTVIQQLRDAEKRYQDKERELLAYKEQQMSKPEVKLEAELSLLRVEKVELERKLESANKSKVHYKQQWGKALKELGKVKQNEQTAARARLKQQEKELEEMRVRFLAAQEKEIANTERKELEDLKNELNRLKVQDRSKQQEAMAEQERLKSQQEAERAMMAAREREEIQRKEELDNKIAKLIEERDTLLQTGVYTTEDRIIVELDRQIREAIACKS